VTRASDSENARSRRPAVVLTGIERPLALTGPGESPWVLSELSTWLTSEGEGPNRAANWAGVRYWP
jgi:hypothetical protein